MDIRKLIASILTLAAASFALKAQSIQVQAPNLVAVNEQFRVVFTMEGEDKVSDFQWSPSADFQLVWGPQKGFSSNTTIANGKMTTVKKSSFTYILLPLSAGKFTLPAATAQIGGKAVQSRSVTVEVVTDGASQSQQNQQSQQSQQPSRQQDEAQSSTPSAVPSGDLFMTMSLSSKNVVIGQPIQATVKLYQRVEISGFEDPKFPTFTGFWSQDISPQGNVQFVREKLGDKIYNSAVLKKYIIIPQQTGNITIDGSELTCLVYTKVSGGGNSIFDGFYDQYTTVRRKVTTSPVTVHVSALPAGAPQGFCGGVGTFSMNAHLTKDTLATHEAASLIINVTGKGNVSLLEKPTVVFPPDIEVYDTKVTESLDRSSGAVSGTKSYEYPFIPRSHGDFVILPVKYAYFDATTSKYVSMQSDTLRFHVIKGAETDSPVTSVVIAGPTKRGVENLSEDVRFIAQNMPSLSKTGKFFVGTPLFIILTLLLVVGAAIFWLVSRKMASRRADVVGTKTRGATKMALKRLQTAKQYLTKNVYSAFYEELHKAVLGFVSDKLNMASSELSKDNISEALLSGGVPQELVSSLVDVLDACEYARYAPDSGNEAMTAHYDQAVSVISSIDSVMKKKKNIGGAAVAMLLLLMPLSGLNAQSADSLWTKATSAYSAGLYEEAAQLYESILSTGVEAPQLYYNTGNAWFKAGYNAQAVLNYERALKLDPSFSDARYNLDVVNARIQDDIEPVPEFILKTWGRKVSHIFDSDVWAVIFLVWLAAFLAMTLMFLLSGSSARKKAGFFAGIFCLILAVGSLSFSLSQKKDYFAEDQAVVMVPVSPAKSSPAEDGSADLFVLHEGTKVTVIDSVAGWTNISLADGRQGWIRTEQIEII